MNRRVTLSVLSALLACVAPLMAQDAIEDVGRAVNFHLARLTAHNPMTRARASDELRVYAARSDGAEHVREELATIAPLLDDPLPVVRWNAAVIVATLGDERQVGTMLATVERGDMNDAGPILDLPARVAAELE